MSIMEVKNLEFAYPMGNKILHAIDFQMEQGEFRVLCGASGCGKTTLLRCMKKQITPAGRLCGCITDLPAHEVGFVFQNPDNQIVTDTVRHELAFGLENVGLPTDIIRKRVAETALFFGIDEWIDASVHEISGGQKQLLNLAAVIAMRPRLLLLDEPVSQLDPIARKNFLEVLVRVNRELGIAVLLSEHHMEEILPLADCFCFLKEGSIAYEGDVMGYVHYLLKEEATFAKALPAAVRIAYALGGEQERYPLTVREGREYVAAYRETDRQMARARLSSFALSPFMLDDRTMCLHIDHIWFQYHKQAPFILKGLELRIRRTECHMILGGNGSGKTTLLSILGKRLFADRGKIRLGKDKTMPRIALLLQNPKAMFSYDTVKEELDAAKVSKCLRKKLKLECFDGQHPYDLSGGEQQRLGLALVMAKEPDILLLDEPTKGLDIVMKEELGMYLKEYAQSGTAVICVTHDVQFAAEFADVCSLLFEGEVLTTQDSASFFSDNAFYTTDSERILRGLIS